MSRRGASSRGDPRPVRFLLLGLLLVGLALALGQPVLAAPPAALDTPRHNHTTTLLDDGRVLVLGGQNATGILAAAELLDPAEGTTVTAPSLGVARSGHTATRLADGRVLVIGGHGPSGPADSTELLDPATGLSVFGALLNNPRSGHTATWLADGRLLIAGGDAEGSLEIYDPASDVFTVLNERMLEARRMHAALRLDDGSVLFVGGRNALEEPLDSAEFLVMPGAVHQPVRGWMHVARVRPGLRLLHDGKVQVFSGDPDGTMELFDPNGNYFRAMTRPELAAPLLTMDSAPAQETDASGGALVEFGRSFSRSDPAELPVPLPRMPQGSASVDVPERGLWLVTGGVDDEGTALDGILAIPRSGADISTDRIDYDSRMVPMVFGRGFIPDETVRLTRQLTSYADPASDVAPTSLLVAVYPDGSFLAGDPAWSPYSPNATYLITAVGLSSGRVAQTAYYNAPQPDPARAPIVSGPTRVEFSVPINGPASAVETELGTLNWGDWRTENNERAPIAPFDPLTLSDDMFSFLGECLPTTPPQVPCINDEQKLQICFEASSGGSDDPDEGRDVTIEGCAHLSGIKGGIWLDGTFGTRLDFDPGEGSILPELRTSVLRSTFELWTDPRIEVLLGLDLSVTFEVPLIPLVKREFEIEGTDIRGDLTIPNIYLGITGGVKDFAVRPYLQVGEVIHEGPTPPREILPMSISPQLTYWPVDEVAVSFCGGATDCRFYGQAGIDVVDYGQAEVKLYLQAKAAAAIAADLGVAEIHTWLDVGTGPYVRGTADLGGFLGGCEPWHVDVDAGVEAWADAGIYVEWPCVDLNCNWHFTCVLGCPWSNRCCAGYWWPSDCSLDCPTTDIPIVDWNDDWWLDVADFWQTGELTVVAATQGVDVDTDGYTVIIHPAELDPGGPFDPSWDARHELTVPPNGSATLDGGVCTVWITEDPTCDPLATYHDMEVDLDSVMWNCRVRSGAILPDVCMDSGSELALDVSCESIFLALQGTIQGLFDTGEILEPEVALDLRKHLARAAEARDNPEGLELGAALGARGVGLQDLRAEARVRSACPMLMGEFLQRIEFYRAAGVLAADVADLLAERGRVVRDAYCEAGNSGLHEVAASTGQAASTRHPARSVVDPRDRSGKQAGRR